MTVKGEVLDAWGDLPVSRKRAGSLGRESITLVRMPELPGVELQHIHHSQRKWTIYHSSFDFCTSTRVTGAIDWRYRNQTNRMSPGAMGVLMPGEMHRVTRLDGEADYLLLLIEPSTVARFLEDEESHVLYSVRPNLEGTQCCTKLAELWDAMTERARDTMRVEGLLTEFLLTVTEEADHRNHASKPRNESTQIVRDYLHDNYHRNVTLDECAKLTGTSKFHLHRSFVAELGIPPHQYLSAIRVSRARDLLRGGTRPAEVAGLTGFCDQSHLTRVFTEIVGLTPGMYAGP